MFGPSQKFSSRDLASHTQLKLRKEGQDTTDEIRKRDLREELEDRERRHFSSKDRSYDDRDRRKGSSAAYLDGPKRDTEERSERPAIKNVDADDSDVEVPSDSDESDDEDDTAELLAALEQIKKEKAEEKLRKERQQQEEEMKVKESELIRGNPLLNPTGSFAVKRRWDDDVVFKNQARGEPKPAKRFINDTIRNDFHRKFLNKYMK
jgi:protein CWC15